MGRVTGLTLEQAKAKRDEMKAQGKTVSTSKSMGKLEDYIKTLDPSKYGAETVTSAHQKLATSTQPQTPGAPGAFGETGLGVPGVTAGMDLQSIYSQAMGSPEITSLESEIASKKEALTTAITNINDNPFYSEATRTGRVAKLEEQAQREMGNLQEQLALKQADAQTQLNIAMKQYDINNQEYQKNLQRLNLLIDSGALLNASASDVAQISVTTGLSTEMIRGIQSKMGEAEVKPSVFTDTDDAGNVTVSIIDANTGNLISTRSLGPIGKATKYAADKTDDKQEAAFYSTIDDGISQLKSGESWGTVWNRIYARFAGSVPHEVLVTLIDQGLGTSWREGGAFQRFKESQTGGTKIEL